MTLTLTNVKGSFNITIKSNQLNQLPIILHEDRKQYGFFHVYIVLWAPTIWCVYVVGWGGAAAALLCQGIFQHRYGEAHPSSSTESREFVCETSQHAKIVSQSSST